MNCYAKNKRGMTVVELMVVIAVLGIIFAVALPQFSKIKENQVLKNAVGDVLSSLNKARSQTLASKDSSSYGVYFESGRIVVFKGEVFSEESSDNETVSLVPPALISNVTLNSNSGATGEIFFERLSGAPSKTGTVAVSTNSYTRNITISATGAVSVD